MDLRSDMASLGLAMLAPDKRQAETATAKRIDRTQTDSVLATAARSLQDGIERALMFHAEFLGLDAEEGGSITVNREFAETTMDPATLRAYTELVAGGSLSIETLWTIMAEGGQLPDDFDADVERHRITQLLGAA